MLPFLFCKKNLPRALVSEAIFSSFLLLDRVAHLLRKLRVIMLQVLDLVFAVSGKVILQQLTMANQLGKIYVCTKCGTQVIVTKGGSGTLKCYGVEMQKK
ncbi:MAG: hypothetical protein ONB07_08655 [candidate division KSB1 bacterium]|nr:hypothetical protein [candidate division KSB1 bacterium]